MSMSINDIFGKASDFGDDLWQNVTGVVNGVLIPSVIAGAEQKAIDLLQGDKAKHDSNTAAGVAAIVNSPVTDPNSLGAKISDSLSNAFTSEFMKKYGLYLIGGVVAIGVVSVFIFGKKGK